MSNKKLLVKLLALCCFATSAVAISACGFSSEDSSSGQDSNQSSNVEVPDQSSNDEVPDQSSPDEIEDNSPLSGLTLASDWEVSMNWWRNQTLYFVGDSVNIYDYRVETAVDGDGETIGTRKGTAYVAVRKAGSDEIIGWATAETPFTLEEKGDYTVQTYFVASETDEIHCGQYGISAETVSFTVMDATDSVADNVSLHNAAYDADTNTYTIKRSMHDGSMGNFLADTNGGSGKIMDMGYVGFDGEYKIGQFVSATFKGKDRPNVGFFFDSNNTLTTGQEAGNTDGLFFGDMGNPRETNWAFFNRITCFAYGPIGTSGDMLTNPARPQTFLPASGETANKASFNGLDENKEYKWTIGTYIGTDEATWVAQILCEIEDGTATEVYRQSLQVSPTSFPYVNNSCVGDITIYSSIVRDIQVQIDILSKDENTAIIEAFGGNANPIEKIALTSVQDLKDKLATATEGYYVLANDIDMAGVTDYVPDATFTGTLDGQGYAIKNFTPGKGSQGYCGLFRDLLGTVKNLAMVDCNYVGEQDAFIARKTEGCTLENVVITTSKASTSPASFCGGFFRWMNGDCIFKNVVFEQNASVGTSSGFIAGMMTENVTVTCENAYFISKEHVSYWRTPSGNDVFYSSLESLGTEKYNNVLKGTYDIYENETAAIKAGIKDNLSAQAATFFQNYVYTPNIDEQGRTIISDAEAFADFIKTATSGSYILTENIDMSSMGKLARSTATFSGVLDGNGFTVSNFHTEGGMFEQIKGTIKNIAFVNVISEDQSVLAWKTSEEMVIENVLVELAEMTKFSNNFQGCLFRYVNSNITLKNCVIIAPEAQKGTFGVAQGYIAGFMDADKKITLENCCIISAGLKFTGYREGYLNPAETDISTVISGTYYVSETVEEFKNNYYDKLSGNLKTWFDAEYNA